MARAPGQVFLQRQCPESLGENAAIAMGILCFPGLCSQHCLETRSYCLDRKRACFSLGIWTWIRIHIPTMPPFVKMNFFRLLWVFFRLRSWLLTTISPTVYVWVWGSHGTNTPLHIDMKASCCSEWTLTLPWQEDGEWREEMGAWVGIGIYREWHLMWQTL